MRPNVSNVESDEQTVQRLIEIAANNDVRGLLHCIQRKPACINAVGVWYKRKRGSNEFTPLQRTPLMVAAACGSFEVVRQILSWSSRADVNRSCGPERVTALHCAALSGSENAGAVVRLLLNSGADPNIADASGRLPRDAVLLSLMQVPSMMNYQKNMMNPAIPNTDEFMMRTFKVYKCSKVGEHKVEACPFYHPSIGDRRRNPRQHGYSSETCENHLRWGQDCPRGDMCEFAHGVNERRVHPDIYKTKVCSGGTNCNREPCFFAHSEGERRGRPTPIPVPVMLPLMASTPYPNTYVQQRRFLNEARSYPNPTHPVHQSSSAVDTQSQTGFSQTVVNGQTPMIDRREQFQQRGSYAAANEEAGCSQRKTSSHEGESSNS